MAISDYTALQQKLTYAPITGVYDATIGRLTLNQRNYAGTYNIKTGTTPTALTVYNSSSAGALNKEVSLHQTANNYIASVLFRIMGGGVGGGDNTYSGVMACYIVDQLVSEANVASNTVATTNFTAQALPRHTSGAGVVLYGYTSSSQTSAPVYYFTYTNQDGVSGRTSKPSVNSFATSLAVGAQPLTAMPLQDGDTGVRSVESITVTTGSSTAGTIGYMLCKPVTPWFYSATHVSDCHPWAEHPVATGLPLCPVDKDACLVGIIGRTDSSAYVTNLFLQIINDG